MQLQQSTFHSSVDSAGARFLRVDSIIAAADWAAAFNARVASYVVNALTAVSSGSKGLDKTAAGVRTLVIAGVRGAACCGRAIRHNGEDVSRTDRVF